MPDINYPAVIVAAIAAFVASTIFYIIFAKQRAQLSPAAAGATRPRPTMMLTEIVRNVILAFVIALLVQRLGVVNSTDAILLALVLWIGFPLVLLSGSVMWEKVPAKLASIHAGDWLVKLLLLTLIVSVWH